MPELNELQLKSIEIVKSKKNLFLTGAPGTGKSYTLFHIISYLKTTNLNYAVTALTGCAAVLIKGQTIHSLFGLGIGNTSINQIVNKLKGVKKYKKIYELDVLIVDEISMMNTELLEKCSDLLCTIKNSNKPFGGIQVIFIGDFYQLAPIEGEYCFLSNIWIELNFTKIELKEYVRQKDDKEFIYILSKIRIGKITTKIFNTLKQLEFNKFNNNILPTKLYPLNRNVDIINNTEFNKLYEILKENNKDTKIIYEYPMTTNNKNINKDEYDIKLIIGLQIIITRNIDITKKLVNGTRGIITNLFDNYVIIKDIEGNFHNIEYYTDNYDNNNTKKILFVKFMPIKLAYALSIHKSQGATLDCIEIDGSSNIFAAGQLYTALSRGRSLSSIRLLNLNSNSFIINKKVKEFYNNLLE